MLKKILATVVFALAVGAAQAQDKDGDIISVSGFVKGSPKGSTFEVGSRKGQFTVDASRAKVTLDGKKFNPSELTGGSQVTVTGKLRGKKLEASEVRVGNLRGSANNKPAEKPSRKPKDTPPVEEPEKEAPKARKPRTKKPADSPVKDAPAKEEPPKSEEPKKKTTRKKKFDSTSKDAPAKDAPKEEPAKDAPKKKTSKKKKSDDKKDEPAKTTGGGN